MFYTMYYLHFIDNLFLLHFFCACYFYRCKNAPLSNHAMSRILGANVLLPSFGVWLAIYLCNFFAAPCSRRWLDPLQSLAVSAAWPKAANRTELPGWMPQCMFWHIILLRKYWILSCSCTCCRWAMMGPFPAVPNKYAMPHLQITERN